MGEENNIFRVVTEITEEQRPQLYQLLEEFETECEEKNSKLPAKIEKKNMFQKLISKFKEKIADLRKQQDNKSMAGDILDGKREDSRLFMLCQGDRLVGFEMAQVSREENDRIVGWKPWMYIKQEFRNTKQEFIDEQGEKRPKNVTLELDRYVENWFEENSVNYQKTSTGINMLPNIITYIGLGFKPVSKSEKNVFLEKDMRKPLSKQEIRDLIKNAKQGIICPKQNPLKERLKSNMSLKEQKANSDRFNQTQNVAVTPNEPSAREEDGK